MMIKLMKDSVEVTQSPFIIESIRVLGDLERLHEMAKNVLYVVIEADKDIRVKRLMGAEDNIDGSLDYEQALAKVRLNDTSFGVKKTVERAKGLANSVVIKTNGLSDELAEVGELNSKLEELAKNL